MRKKHEFAFNIPIFKQFMGCDNLRQREPSGDHRLDLPLHKQIEQSREILPKPLRMFLLEPGDAIKHALFPGKGQ